MSRSTHPTVLRHALPLGATFGFALLVSTLPSFAADWPQWRGSNRDGRSAETGLLATWPAGGPPKAWSAAGFGTGFSSLAVSGQKIYTLGDLADGQYLIAAHEKDGKIAWKLKVGAIWDDEFPGPRSTPTVSGGRVFAMGTDSDLVAVDATTGKELWRRNLVKEFGGTQMKAQGSYTWKWAESPLVDGERVIVTPGAADAFLVALEVATGKEVWRTKVDRALGSKGDDGAGYSAAVVSEAGGVRQIVQLVGRGVVGVDAGNGKLLWSYNPVANNVANIPTPLVSGNQIFVSTGYGTGAARLDLAKTGTGVTATEAYFLPAATFQNHHGNMILDQGTVYAGHGHNRGYPVALELATGKLRWGPAENKGNGSAAVAFADGKLYFRYQNGLMVLIEATPEAYRELGSFTIPEVKRQSWAHPVIANGRLLLREQDAIHVYDLRGSTAAKPAAAGR